MAEADQACQEGLSGDDVVISEHQSSLFIYNSAVHEWHH